MSCWLKLKILQDKIYYPKIRTESQLGRETVSQLSRSAVEQTYKKKLDKHPADIC